MTKFNDPKEKNSGKMEEKGENAAFSPFFTMFSAFL